MTTRRIRRRTLLAGTACAALAAAAPRALAAEQAPAGKWKMKLSTSTIQFTRLPVEQAIERIAGLGFEAVDIWSPHAKCPHLDDVQNRLKADGLKQLLDKNKIKLYAFSVYAGGYAKYADLLGQMGGGIAIHGSAGRVKDPKDLVPAMKKFFENLKGEAELAEKHDSYIAVENHGGSLLCTLDSFKAFVDHNPYKRVGIALAPYHVQAARQSVEQAIATCGKQLLFFYAWQNAPGVQQLPGLGPTDVTPWLAELAKIGYAHYVNPFMHHEPPSDEMVEALKKSKAYLEECYKKI